MQVIGVMVVVRHREPNMYACSSTLKTFKYVLITECLSVYGRIVDTLIAVQSNLQCILLICACRTEVTWLLEEIP